MKKKTTTKNNKNGARKMFRLAVQVLMLAVVMSGLTACGGTNFVRSNIDPLKGTEKVGVLVVRHEIVKQGMVSFVSISDKLNEGASAMVGSDLESQIAKKGFTPILIPANDKVAAIVQKYKDLPRSGRRVVSDPQEAEFGDLHELFKEHGVDYILFYEGESVPRKGALGSFASAGVSLGISVLTSSVVSSGLPARGFTITYTGAMGPNGKLSYYNREQFTKKGDFFSTTEREGMMEAVVNGWAASQKK